MTRLFGHSVRSELLVLYVLEAVLCFGVAYLFLTVGVWGGSSAEPRLGLALAAGLSLSTGLLAGAAGLYHPDAWSRTKRLLLGTAVAACLLLLGGQLVLSGINSYWPEVVIAGGLRKMLFAFALATIATRLGFAAAAQQGLLRRRLAVVRAADAVPLELIAGPRTGRNEPFEVTFSVPANAPLGEALHPQRLRQERIWAVILPDSMALPELQRRLLTEAGARVYGEAEFLEMRQNRVDIDKLPAGWLSSARGANAGWLEAAAHRALDLVVSLVMLTLALPVLALTAIAIKFDSSGPIFYGQERVGRGNRVFTVYKFRSMVVDAEAAGAPKWATKGDPRVTRIGRLLRLTRVDEIPQFINVLRGDMAVVGPRPERPGFVEQLAQVIPHYNDRACVKPGITGWAQVNYPYGASVEDSRNKLAYDLYYIRRRSLFLDLLTLIATVRVVLFQEGAR